ncbi:DUF453-domain-containing protein [Violaceomyces palustris]|uniref:DUF453-domain-containing protein n=1 Tax=Violaceomyces palustris TaxID=1673888 RepID=A0ACD0P8Z0_9BASI|nr:DUF453-domain-containing protein [Violaceomyces palustris]
MLVRRVLSASFYRGGTSKGLILDAFRLARYPQASRDRLILQAMGSPDPDRRQIDGLGGGISSLSKVAIVGKLPSFSLIEQLGPEFHLPISEKARGIIRDKQRSRDWDVVYVFGQVPVHGSERIDWSSTCGNLISSVALFSIDQGIVEQTLLNQRFFEATSSPQADLDVVRMEVAVKLLIAASGQIVRVHVPVIDANPDKFFWLPELEGDTSIAGVPGKAPAIKIEAPLENSGDVKVLSTGNERDEIELDGKKIPVTVINAGLPTIFVTCRSLNLSPEDLDVPPSTMDSNVELMSKLESIRQKVCQLNPFLSSTSSPSAPKICIVAPPTDYTTTGGEKIYSNSFDLLVRAISVGNVHRTIPATALSALAVSRAFSNSNTSEEPIPQHRQDENKLRLIHLTVGQPAGLSSSSVKVNTETSEPESTIYVRTARLLIKGLLEFLWDSARMDADGKLTKDQMEKIKYKPPKKSKRKGKDGHEEPVL